MAFKLGDLIFKISGDSKPLENSINRATDKARGFGSVLGKLGPLIVATFGVRAIIQFGKSIIKAASDAEETANKFKAVFNGIGSNATAAAKELSTSFLLSRTAAKDLLATTGNILQSFGYTKKASLDASLAVNKLAADLISFSNANMSIAEASGAVTKALLGEREQLKTLGISVTDKDLQDLAKTHGQVYEAMTKQERAALTLELINIRAKNQIGDVARSMGSYANQMRLADSNIANIRESLGKALLPVVTLGVTAFNSIAASATESADRMHEFATSAEGAKKIGSTVGGIASAFRVLWGVFKPVNDLIISGLKEVAQSFGEFGAKLGGPSDRLRTFAMIMQVALIPLKLLYITLFGTLKLLIDMGKALFEVGRGFANFGALLKGKISVKEFVAGFAGVSKEIKKLGEDLNDIGKKYTVAISSGFDRKAADRAAKEADALRTRLSASVETALVTSRGQSVLSDQPTVEGGSAVTTSGGGAKSAGAKAAIDDSTAAILAVYNAFGLLEGKAKEAWQSITPEQQLIAQIQGVANAFGYVGQVLQSVGDLASALNERRLNEIESERQAALEAAGVAEETAVEKAQRELEEAQATGDAKVIKEKEDALKRAKINEEYDKKRRKAEYEGALLAWKLQLASTVAMGAQAVLNSFASAAAIPVIGWSIAPGVAAAAGVLAALQIAAVAAAKPQAPKFANGGLVPGSSFTGDTQLARVNSGELILNRAQQDTIANQLSPAATTKLPAMSKESLFDMIWRASQDGLLYIDNRALQGA